MVQSLNNQVVLGKREWLILSDNNKPEPVGPDNKPLRDKPMKKELREPSKIDNEFFDDSNIAGYMGQDEDVEQAQYNVMSLIEDKFGGLNKQIDRISKELETAIGKNKDDISELKGELCIPFLKDKCNTKTKQGCLKCADYYKELNQLPEDCYDPGLLNMHCQYTNTYTNSENQGADISSSPALDLDNSSKTIKCDDLEHFDCKAVIEDNYNSFQSHANKLCLWDEEGKQYNKPIIEDDSSSLNIKCRNMCNSYTDENECENKEGCFYSEGKCVEKICENRMNSEECQLNEGTSENGRCGVSNYGYSVESQNSEDNPFFKNWRRWFGIYPKDDPEINTCVMKNLKSDGTLIEKGRPPQQYAQTERDYCLSDMDPTNPAARGQSSNVGYFISSQDEDPFDNANRGVTPNGNGPDYWSTFKYSGNTISSPNILPYCRTSENIKKDTHNLEGGQSITGTVNCLSSGSAIETDELSSIDEYWFGSEPNVDTDNPCNQNNLNRDYENSQSSESGGEGSGGRTITQLYNDQSCELRESDYLTNIDRGLRDINFGKMREGNSSGCYYGSDVKYEGSDSGSQIDEIFAQPVCKSKDPDSIPPCNILRKDSNYCEKYNSEAVDGSCYRSKEYCYPRNCGNIETSKFTSTNKACKIGVDSELKKRITGLNSLCVANSDDTECKDETKLNKINETVDYIKKRIDKQYDQSFWLCIFVPTFAGLIILGLISLGIGSITTNFIGGISFFILMVVYVGKIIINFIYYDPLNLFFKNYSDNLKNDTICSTDPPPNDLYDKMKQYVDCLDKIDPLSPIQIDNMNDGNSPKFTKRYTYFFTKANISDEELEYTWHDCWRIHLESFLWVLSIGSIGGLVALLVNHARTAHGGVAAGAAAAAAALNAGWKFFGFLVCYSVIGCLFFLWTKSNEIEIETQTISNYNNENIIEKETISDDNYKKVPATIRKELGIDPGVDISNITICESESLRPNSSIYTDENKNIYDLFYKDLTNDIENKYVYKWNTSGWKILFFIVCLAILFSIIITVINIWIGVGWFPNWANLLDHNSDKTKLISIIVMILLIILNHFITDNFDHPSHLLESTSIHKLCGDRGVLDINDNNILKENPPNQIETYYNDETPFLSSPPPTATNINGSCKIDNNNSDRGSFCDINDYSQDIEGNSAKEDITTTNSSKYCIPYSKWSALVNNITGDDSNLENYKTFLNQQVLFNTYLKNIRNDSESKNKNLAFDYEEHHESIRSKSWWIIFCILFIVIHLISWVGGLYTDGGPGGWEIAIYGFIGIIQLVICIYVTVYYNLTTDYIKKDFVEIITSSYNEVKGKSYEERGNCSVCYAKKQNTNTGDYDLIKINIPPGSRKSKSYECDKFNGCLVNELKNFNAVNGGDHICKGKGFTEGDIDTVKRLNTNNCDINVGGVSINIDDMYYYNDGLPGDYRDLDGVWEKGMGNTNIENDPNVKDQLIKNLDSKYRSWYISSSGDILILMSAVLTLIGVIISYNIDSKNLLYISFIVGIVCLVGFLMYYRSDYNDTIDILNEKLKPEQGFIKEGQEVTKFSKIKFPFFGFFGANMETDDNRFNCKISTTSDEDEN